MLTVRIDLDPEGHTSAMPDDRAATRRELLPEEKAAGSADPQAQTEQILAESDERAVDRDAAPTSDVEHRTSDEATPPA